MLARLAARQDEAKRAVLERDVDLALPPRLVCGVDISFVKEDPDVACVGIVVLDYATLEVRYLDLCTFQHLRAHSKPVD